MARAWSLRRGDGLVLGFTDHDRDLEFAGIRFQAETGMTARALALSTGLAPDNSEALGALSAQALTEADITAGRWDGAALSAWLVNWADPRQHRQVFQGQLGEITRRGQAFGVELRGLAEALNRAQGRVFLQGCSAALGDGQCRVDLATEGYRVDLALIAQEGEALLRLPSLPGHAARWFERGRLTVLSGAAAGLWGQIKNDRDTGAERLVELWQGLRAPLRPGDHLRLEAGCDKRADTCRLKFDNMLNFRGFPNIPGEDWLMVLPAHAARNGGR